MCKFAEQGLASSELVIKCSSSSLLIFCCVSRKMAFQPFVPWARPVRRTPVSASDGSVEPSPTETARSLPSPRLHLTARGERREGQSLVQNEWDTGMCAHCAPVTASPSQHPARLFIKQHLQTSEHKPRAPDRGPARSGHSPCTPEDLAGLGFPKPSFLTL